MIMIKIKVAGRVYHVKAGMTISEILQQIDFTAEPDIVVAAVINNVLYDLDTLVNDHTQLDFLTIKDEIGNRIYRRSLFLLLVKAIYQLFPASKLSIEHSLSNGIYCELHKDKPLNQHDLGRIEKKMRDLIKADHKINGHDFSREQLISIFSKQGFSDKVRLLQQLAIKYPVYELDGFYDYFFYNMLPRTGLLDRFRLQYRMPGFIILYPQRNNPYSVPDFIDQPKLAKIFYEYEKWGEIINVADVSELNQLVNEGKYGDLIRISEALHEKKIAKIADQISNNLSDNRVILIAGPSSSGKTTFAQRLAIQLRVNGLIPVAISTDNYFVDREQTPLDPEGNYDFEALEAIDLDLFNQQLIQIIQGREVEMPIFDFQKGRRSARGKLLRIAENQPIIIEGIHSLNERLTEVIPAEHKYKIYISALTQLNLDRHNRIPTTDTRIIRRIVRDYYFRNNSAAMTINWWPSVRKGEERNIFPYQENADVMFNSALIYELAVLKNYCQPLLQQIETSERGFYQARRLLRILDCFVPIKDEADIPRTSIIKEFIGGSAFN